MAPKLLWNGLPPIFRSTPCPPLCLNNTHRENCVLLSLVQEFIQTET